MSKLMPTYRPAPVCFVSGKGCRLQDHSGKEYLDFLSGVAVTSLGHSHPRIAEALSAQARKLLHVSNLFQNDLNERAAALIDELIGEGTPGLGKVFFANSGAEANECAIKLARRFGGRGRYGVVSAYGSFHGRTLATLHATGQPAKHEAYAPLPEGFSHVIFGDLEEMARAADPTKVAAVLLEVIQGEGGVIPAPPGYLKKVRQLCDDRGILLMIDEVQTGLARTGRWFGFHHEEIVPDVVTMAKALGNGVPVGACWAKSAVADTFQPGDHATTFGGQPLALSAVLSTLETMIELNAPHLAEVAHDYLVDQLRQLPGVVEVRGRGLLLGLVLGDGLDALSLVDDALYEGLVINAPVAGVLRLTPPLIVSREECDEAIGVLRVILDRALYASTVSS